METVLKDRTSERPAPQPSARPAPCRRPPTDGARRAAEPRPQDARPRDDRLTPWQTVLAFAGPTLVVVALAVLLP